MGKPLLMLRGAGDERIESLEKRRNARTRIDVVRSALDLLERNAEHTERVATWPKAAAVHCGLTRDSDILVDQILAWDNELFGRDLGLGSEAVQDEVRLALLEVMDLL